MVRLFVSLTLCAALLPGAASACRLALVLALDVSSSVDETEYFLQRDGVAAALVSEDVIRAITQDGPIALAIYEWSGRRQSSIVQDWVMLGTRTEIEAVATRLYGAERSYRRFPTALGFALGFGAELLQRAPSCDRRVIDVSGDGVTNDGFGPFYAYKHFPFDGVTVNGLAVLGADPAVMEHFEFEVLHGPGAFLEAAEGYEGYQNAMERKLFREISDRIVSDLRPQKPYP
ncbi:DUF1194 domain-containing protein [Sagittula salina]|uniref:DUF1194 domain-containing protein n=1 Tax=Sagittula salina TaxID=2820268 RepID=UPI001FD7F2DB|nr:DUF1194 domain-containing protein [Sagittula salina]